jgi:hypothetical protein
MSAIDDLKTLNDLIADPNVRAKGSARYKNKSYTLAQLVAEQKVVSKKAEKEKQAIEAAKQKAGATAFEERKQAEAQQEESDRAIRRARGELEAAQGNLTIAITRNGDIEGAQTVLGEAYRKLQGLNPTDKMLEGIVIPQVSRGGGQREGGTEAATSGAGISLSTADTAERASQKATEERLAKDESLDVRSVKEVVENGVTLIVTTFADGSVTKTAKVTPTGGKVGGSAVPVITTPAQDARKAFVDAELVKRKLEDTPANRAALRKEYKPAVVVPSTEWEATFRSTFPAKAWLLDQDRTKYPQLFALIQRAHDEKYTPERFAQELPGVDFYRQLASSGKVREIKGIVGDLGFDSTDFSKFVTDSINFGWTGETLKAETYKEVFRRNPDGTYANPTSVKRATSGNDYLGVQLIAKNYFNSAPQSSIESVLTGTITTQDFQRQQREIAKKRYGHLADLIDQGVTLEDLAGNYKQTAAKLLEVDPNTIDMSQGDYEVALSFGEEGKKRAMTTGEWEKLLRTDSRYGWEKTENAKSEARSLANNLAQAFGRII